MKSKYAHVGLQWFGDADYDEETTPIPTMEDPVYEVVDSLDDEEEEDVVKLSREEFSKLSSKGEEKGPDMGQVMGQLAKAINDGRAPEGTGQVQPQQQGETWEEYLKRVDDEVFGANPSKAIVGIVERMTGNTVAQMSQVMMGQAKKLMELDPKKGKYYVKYKDDIEKKLKGYPVQWQNNPQALEQAYKDVLAEHQEDIVEESVEARIEAEVEKRLKERGVSGGSREEFDEGRGQSKGPSRPNNVKKIVLTDSEKNTARLMGFAANKEGYARFAKFKYGGKR